MPGPLDYELISHVWELCAQDKWAIRNGLTVSLGIRYDLEVIPIDEDPGNPLFSDPSKYPVDKNNVAPRHGVHLESRRQWQVRGARRLRARSTTGRCSAPSTTSCSTRKYSNTFTASFPQNAADPGPSRGQLPTEFVLNTTTVNQLTPAIRAYLNGLFPPGTVRRNTGTQTLGRPRPQAAVFPSDHRGREREVMPGLSVVGRLRPHAGAGLFFNPNLNIGTRRNTTRTGTIDFFDPYGLLNRSLAPGEARLRRNRASADYQSTGAAITTR